MKSLKLLNDYYLTQGDLFYVLCAFDCEIGFETLANMDLIAFNM